jgi:hypothetical protein
MRLLRVRLSITAALALVCGIPFRGLGEGGDSLADGPYRATIRAQEAGGFRSYELTSNAPLRDNDPPGKRIDLRDLSGHARVRSGSLMFDGLYALAVTEAVQNSVSEIRDGAYNRGNPIRQEVFQTGALWTYVWTRDLSYSAHLALAEFDPTRAANSLWFKCSIFKASINSGLTNQVVQDTGSGGSYPISSDRIVWALGVYEVLKHLEPVERGKWLTKVYPVLRDTLEEDRRLVFDARDGLYRGEQSFLDWREQTYPAWTKDNVQAIGASKALSVNAADYAALRITAELAGRLGRHEEEGRYAGWAAALKEAINSRLTNPGTGLYSAYLLSDVGQGVPVHRYDLLGECLAVLLGVADDTRANAIIGSYPAGPYGTPVVWPEERTVPIYHNHAIWPFVTAYWTKAARQVNNAEAVNRGIRSLMRGAALNLSNMENFDFATGNAWARHGSIEGPVINSRRQIWSVAGYLSMVQDVVFGLETSWDGIRFLPYVTSQLRRETFGSSSVLELRDFSYQGKLMQVRVLLPRFAGSGQGACPIVGIKLNGREIGRDFVPADSLPAESRWEIKLGPPDGAKQADVREVKDVSDERTVFGPVQPQWSDEGQGGITADGGRLTLHYRDDEAGNVVFNIYRDGRLCAKAIRDLEWTDPDSANHDEQVRGYAIEAVDERTGNSSHLSPTRRYLSQDQQRTIPARAMENRGGNLVDGNHFENWGKPGDELAVKSFMVERSGRYEVRAEFANGAGPVNTGITCGIKSLEVAPADGKGAVATGYLIMPQSGDWKRFDVSSAVEVELVAGRSYSFRIGEDEYCRNMSCLRHNEHYTAFAGGGDASCNFVNIASLRLIRLGP